MIIISEFIDKFQTQGLIAYDTISQKIIDWKYHNSIINHTDIENNLKLHKLQLLRFKDKYPEAYVIRNLEEKRDLRSKVKNQLEFAIEFSKHYRIPERILEEIKKNIEDKNTSNKDLKKISIEIYTFTSIHCVISEAKYELQKYLKKGMV